MLKSIKREAIPAEFQSNYKATLAIAAQRSALGEGNYVVAVDRNQTVQIDLDDFEKRDFVFQAITRRDAVIFDRLVVR